MSIRTDPKATTTRRMTVIEWGELDGSPRYELVDGRLEEKPDVAFWHEILLLNLVHFLDGYARTHRLGFLVTSKAKLKISDFGGREPDIFWVPTDQYHLVGKNLFKGTPPLVVEILSESTERTDRGAKRREYAGLGVGQSWLVDLPSRRIEVLALVGRPDGSREYEVSEVVKGDAVFRPAPFPGLEIPLAEVWPVEFEDRTD